MIIAAYAPFTRLQSVLLEPYAKFLDTVGQSLATGLGPVVLSCATLYILFNAVRMVRGETDEPIGEFVKMSLKIGAIAALALNFETYRYYVANPLVDGIPNTISQMFVGEQMPTVNQFDSCAASLGIFLAKAWKGVAWYDYGGMFRVGSWSIIITIVGAGVIVSGFLLTMFTKAIMYLVLSLGPAFIVCAMFEQTRTYLNHFIGSAVTLIIQQILVAAVMGLILNTLKEAMVFTSAEAFAVDCMNILLLSLFVSYIFYQIPTMAQRLGGNGIAAALPAMMYARQAGRQSVNSDLPPELRTDGGNTPGRNGGSNALARPGARTETAHTGPQHSNAQSQAGGSPQRRSGDAAVQAAALGVAATRANEQSASAASFAADLTGGAAQGNGALKTTVSGGADDDMSAFAEALERGSHWQTAPSYEGVSVSANVGGDRASTGTPPDTVRPAGTLDAGFYRDNDQSTRDSGALSASPAGARTETLAAADAIDAAEFDPPHFAQLEQASALSQAASDMRRADGALGDAIPSSLTSSDPSSAPAAASSTKRTL